MTPEIVALMRHLWHLILLPMRIIKAVTLMPGTLLPLRITCSDCFEGKPLASIRPPCHSTCPWDIQQDDALPNTQAGCDCCASTLAGTDANVYINIFGEKGETGQIMLDEPNRCSLA